jgi:uncharacterized membrane protein
VPALHSDKVRGSGCSANLLTISCPHCAAQMPETAAFCPGCGRPLPVATRAEGRVGAFPESIAGALAYITFIPAIAFLLIEPYKQNRFARFHSIQCLGLWVVAVVMAVVLKVLGLVLFIIPVLGHLLAVLISVVVGLACVVVWLVLVVKALQGEMFKLPVLGDFSEQRANAAG